MAYQETHQADNGEGFDRRTLLRAAVALGVGALAACSQEQPNAERRKGAEYPLHTEIIATVFFLGEEASDDNAGISNVPTAWDSNSVERLGGIDYSDYYLEADGRPSDFKPKHNIYYFALPADEYDENGPIAGAHEASPWADQADTIAGSDASLFKGRWIEVSRADATVYAQWVDCGPSDDPDATRDYGYVFGDQDQRPKNTYNLKAGLDLSPAAARGLGFGYEEGGAPVAWRFVDEVDVPDGPWREYPAIDNKTYWE